MENLLTDDQTYGGNGQGIKSAREQSLLVTAREL